MLYGLSRFWRRFLRSVRTRPGRTTIAIFLLLMLSLFGNAWVFWWFEGARDPSIHFGDALWYSIISITTIGYGDFSATTAPARWATVIAIAFVGLPVFSMFIGMVAEQMVAHHEKERRGVLPVDEQGHMLILNCPSKKRVRDITREFRADVAFRGTPIFLVADSVDTNPLSEEEIGFVKGSPIDEEILRQANIDRADTVIILSPDYRSTDSDAQVAAALTLVESIRPEIRTIAECLDERHQFLFDSAHADAVVHPLQMVNNTIVQVSQDPGVGHYLNQVLSNSRGESIYSTQIPEDIGEGFTYLDLARAFLEERMVLQAIMTKRGLAMDFVDRPVSPGDRVIYHAPGRLTGAQIKELLASMS